MKQPQELTAFRFAKNRSKSAIREEKPRRFKSAIRDLEEKIVRQVIKDALAAGYKLTVNDGQDDVLTLSTKPREVFGVMFSTDEDYLFLREGPEGNTGWVRFVYGNDGWDVVNDYTTNIEAVMKGATEISDRYS
jgi:hypothetical protein